MSKIKIPEIHILPRQRKEIDTEEYQTHIQELSDSIKKHGLIQPIVLDSENNLVAGFSRIYAHLQLGLDEIEYIRTGDLTEIQRKEMELEENIRRKNLEWWEEAEAIAEIHDLKLKEDPNWTLEKTAAMVGKSIATISQSLDLNKAMGEDQTLKTENTLRSALKKRSVVKKIEKKKVELEQRKKKGKKFEAAILVGDALELIQKEESETFDAVVTNFPFGVDLTYKSGHIPYHDDEKYISQLVQGIVNEAYRVLREDSWLVAWFDVRKITYNNAQREWIKAFVDILPKVKKVLTEDDLSYALELLTDSMGLAYWLEQAGFSYVSLIPSIWYKPNKSVGQGDMRKVLISSYEAMIFAAKGDAVLLKQGRQNVFVHETPSPSERVHSVQMPVSICSEVLQMVCLGGSYILDPFAGSGSIGVAAVENQCNFRGYEINPEYADAGNVRLQEALIGDQDVKREA